MSTEPQPQGTKVANHDVGAAPEGVAISAPSGPPEGFSKGVNEYLNHYVTVADAKAAGFLVADVTFGAAAIKLSGLNGGALFCQWAAIVALSVSAAACTFAIWPRLPSGKCGVIFWEYIRAYRTMGDYQQAVSPLTIADVEMEYAAQNYFVADVVHRKLKCVQWAIVLFLIGAALAVAAYEAR